MKTVYSREFKVEMCEKVMSGKNKHADVAAENGISSIMLYRWISEYKQKGDSAFCGKGSLLAVNAELKRLREENDRLKKENSELKSDNDEQRLLLQGLMGIE